MPGQRQLSDQIDDATQRLLSTALLTRRLVEVELHHCDLDAGYGPGDWPAAFTAMELAEPVRSLRQDRLARASQDKRLVSAACGALVSGGNARYADERARLWPPPRGRNARRLR